MAKIEVFLLQAPHVLLDGQPVAFPYKKTEALFYYMVAEKTCTRDLLATLLWEDAGADTARKNLRNALYMLKKSFGQETVTASQGFNLILHPDIALHCDLYDFLDGDTSVYQNDFLCNFTVKKTTLFEDWLIRKREYLKNLYLVKLYEHIHALPSDHLTDIELSCTRYMQLDSFDERIVYALMKAYGDNHLYLKGIQAYQKLRKELEDELGIVPGHEITQYYKKLRTDWAESATEEEEEDRQVIAARAKEVRLLKQTYQEFLHGHIAFVMIEGETGVGKSTLVQSLTDTIAQDNVLFLEASCYMDEMSTLLYPWNTILLQLDEYIQAEGLDIAPVYLQTIAQFFPTFGNQSPTVNVMPLDLTNAYNLRAVQNCILRILMRVTERIPILLTIDNLHCADPTSLQLLSGLMRELHHNFLVIATSLDAPSRQISEFITHFPDRVSLQKIHLDRFSITDMEEIIAARTDLDPIPENVLESIYETTAGNAFFLHELLTAYKDQGDFSSISTQAQTILAQRLSGLSIQSRQLLDIISLLHNHASLELLEHVHGRNPLDILESLEELTSRALILERQRQGKVVFAFTHTRMQEYVCELIPPSKRRALYASIACALEQILPSHNNASYQKLTHYFQLANVETKVLKYQIYPFEQLSITLFELYPSGKVTDNPAAPKNLPEYFTDIEQRLKKSRHDFETPEEYESLTTRLLMAKSRYYILSGLYNEGLISLRKCFRLDYIQRHPSYLLQAYRQMIYYGIQLYEPSIMRQYLDKGLALSGEQNYLMERALFLRLNGLYHLMVNAYEACEQNLMESISIFEHHSTPTDIHILNISAAYNYLGELARKQQRPDHAMEYYNKAIRFCQQNNLSVNPIHLTNLGSAYLAMGDMEAAQNAYEAACTLYDDSYTLMGRSVAKCRLACFVCKDGDFTRAFTLLDEANHACNQLGSPVEKGLYRKTQAELLLHFPQECREYLPEPFDFYVKDARRLMSVDYMLPEWKELERLTVL